MTGKAVNGSENGARSGAQALVLLAPPLTPAILRGLADGAKHQADLRRITGTLAQTTLRTQLNKLVAVGAIEKHRRNRFPGVIEYELTATGDELLLVADVLGRWLDDAPAESRLDGDGTKAAVKALVDSWSGELLRALATRPSTLTELSGIVSSLSYPSIERRLAALRVAELIEAQPRPGVGRGVPYAPTSWLRRGLAPLLAAARWERRNASATSPPLEPADIETALLLAAPLARIAKSQRGACRLAVDDANGHEGHPVGVVVEARDGLVAVGDDDLGRTTDAWIVGSAFAWSEAVIEGHVEALELGGDCRLGRVVLLALHRALFKVQPAIYA